MLFSIMHSDFDYAQPDSHPERSRRVFASPFHQRFHLINDITAES